MLRTRVVSCLLGLVALSMVAGCGGGTSESSSGRSFSKEEKAAADLVMSEMKKHCVQTSDGWTTALSEGTTFAPIDFVRTYKEVVIDDVESFELSQSDKLNGFEWTGKVKFKEVPIREAGDNNYVGGGRTEPMVTRPKGRWSQWVSYVPWEIRVQKHNGKWEIPPTDSMTLLSGHIPTAQDYAKAGVK